MSRNNTGNPIGSKAFPDFEDNVPNLDVAVNSDQDTWRDRLGKSRLTWAGIERAGAGDPAIAVDAAARAEAAAQSVEEDAEQIAQEAAQQAVDNVVVAVDGAVDRAEDAADRAESEADRAEAASDAAFVNADVYPDVATGLAAVAVGEQFLVVEGSELVRYEKISVAEAKEVARSPTSGAVSEIARALESRASTSPEHDIFQVVDASGQITVRQDAEGMLFLPDLDSSVQEAVSRASRLEGNLRAFDFEASSGERVASILADGDYALPGFPSGVVKATMRHAVRPSWDRRMCLSDSACALADELARRGALFTGAPNNLQPQNYTIRDNVVFEVNLETQSGYIPLDSPYAPNDRFVHPYIMEFLVPFRGYRYLMCINPYSAETHENPTIYGGNDLRQWDLLDGFDQPLAEPPTSDRYWLSDSSMTYDPTDGSLVCIWRESERRTDGIDYHTLYYRKTWDGYGWTDRSIIVEASPGNVDAFSTPAFLYDPALQKWRMWVWTTLTPEGPSAVLREADMLEGPWSVVATIRALTTWHAEIKFVGDKYVALLNDRDPGSNYTFAISDDGVNWVRGGKLLPDPQEALYKASFIPVLGEDGIAFDVLWTTNHHSNPDLVRRIFYARTNFVGME